MNVLNQASVYLTTEDKYVEFYQILRSFLTELSLLLLSPFTIITHPDDLKTQ